MLPNRLGPEDIPTASLQRVKPPSQRVSWFEAKQSDGEVPVMQELWEMKSTPLLLSLPGPLCPGVVAPDRILSIGQIELNCVLMLNWIVFIELFWHLTEQFGYLNCVLMRNWFVLNITVFWHLNCILMLKWSVWNKTVYIYINGFGIYNEQGLIAIKPN